jgi:hypothetical protein
MNFFCSLDCITLLCVLPSVRIRVNTAVVNSNESVLITYTVLITTILAIISSSTVLLNVIVGPGEHDPTGSFACDTQFSHFICALIFPGHNFRSLSFSGMLNKLFYADVPTLHHTKSTAVFKIERMLPSARKWQKSKRCANFVSPIRTSFLLNTGLARLICSEYLPMYERFQFNR